MRHLGNVNAAFINEISLSNRVPIVSVARTKQNWTRKNLAV